ncbi:MAG: CoA-binding protein, partial [Thermomicrobiales bacterium]|nr:CoA-binding protein [Thermomicrobiales bacterium]
MSILVDRDSRVLVQGITGREGTFHTTQMVEYGTNVVAGVTPGGAGKVVAGVPVFNTVADAVAAAAPNVAIIFVPARFAPDAIYEALDNGIPFVICITEGIPVADMVPVYAHVREQGARLLGPNCPGLITPGQAKIGIMP